MKTILNESYYDVNEVSEMLSVSKITVFSYVKKGKLKAVKLANKFWIKKESVQELLNPVKSN